MPLSTSPSTSATETVEIPSSDPSFYDGGHCVGVASALPKPVSFSTLVANIEEGERKQYFEALLKALMASKYHKSDKHLHMVQERLFIGSVGAASNMSGLRKAGVTHILCVTGSVEPRFPGEFEYMQVDIPDVPTADITSHFDKCHEFINQGRQAGGVLVHCFAGKSRSATILISYLMKTNGWSLARAAKHLRKSRSVVAPNAGFVKQLQDYERTLAVAGAPPAAAEPAPTASSDGPCVNLA